MERKKARLSPNSKAQKHMFDKYHSYGIAEREGEEERKGD